MIKNYIKTAFRAMLKNGAYSLLNILGLAVGITCAALILLWVEDEVTYNHQFEKRDRLYITKNNQTYDGTTFTFDATPGKLGPAIKSEITGIKNTARVNFGSQLLFKLNDKSIYEQGVYADSSLFSMLKLPFAEGKADGAFNQVHSVVISEKMAHKFFGDAAALGKTIKINDGQDYTVSGVIRDLPDNVSFQFDWIAPFKLYMDDNKWLEQWGNNGIQTYVELDPHANLDAINRQMNGFVQTKAQGTTARLFIFPMNKWRLYNKFTNGKSDGGRIKYVKLFSTIAWIIIIIACINFMNLATARSEKRAKEVGVRKVIGAQKHMLISQFIGESLFMSFIAVLVAVGLIFLALPAFNKLVDKDLGFAFTAIHILGLLAIGLICGLLAGSYPAFYLSSFRPILVLKGLKQKTNFGSGFIRQVLVTLQFTISIGLIISTLIIYNQVQYVRSRDLGYNKNNLVYLNLKGQMTGHFEAIRNDLINSGAAQNAALSRSMVLQMGSNTGDFSWEGKDPTKKVLITIETVSPQYVSTMGMKLQGGRDFYPAAATDSTNVIINESLAKIMAKNGNVVGRQLNYGGGQKFTVVGVVKDFVYNNMYADATPLILFCDPANTNFLTIRLKDNANIANALSKVESVIKANNPGYPVAYNFVDDQFNQYFKSEVLIGKLAGVFAVLAIVISCLGLFGLSAFTAERRTREIGIRKVLGASISGLATLLSKDFILMVLLSCVISFPLSWWMMHNWLQDYQYRASISLWVFVIAGMSAIIIAVITVSFQAVKAALMNPVKSLRSE